jgi:adenylylsulfate kinase-like enzyme
MPASQQGQGWAVWIVGLPGSGKSDLARWLYETLLQRGEDTRLLQMDSERAKYARQGADAYTEAGREKAYAQFVAEAASLAASGAGVTCAPPITKRAPARTVSRAAPVQRSVQRPTPEPSP